MRQNARNEGRKGGKLDTQFRGPYTVKNDLGKGRFELEDGSGKLLKKTYKSILICV